MVLLSIIVLVFVNYSHSKNAEIMPLQFSLNVVKTPQYVCNKHSKWQTHIGVRAGGARGAAAPPNFGQPRFFGQREKIWAKPVFKDVSILFNYFKDLNINLK